MERAAPQPKSAWEVIRNYFLDFKVLKDCPREYWTIQVINLLDSFAYFAFLNIAVVFLSENLGFSDVRAGYVFTIFTTTTTLMLFFSGFITDSLGIRKALYLAMALLLISRGGIVACGFFPGIPHRADPDLAALPAPRARNRHGPDGLPVGDPPLHERPRAKRRVQHVVPGHEHRRGAGRIRHRLRPPDTEGGQHLDHQHRRRSRRSSARCSRSSSSATNCRCARRARPRSRQSEAGRRAQDALADPPRGRDARARSGASSCS